MPPDKKASKSSASSGVKSPSKKRRKTQRMHNHIDSALSSNLEQNLQVAAEDLSISQYAFTPTIAASRPPALIAVTIPPSYNSIFQLEDITRSSETQITQKYTPWLGRGKTSRTLHLHEATIQIDLVHRFHRSATPILLPVESTPITTSISSHKTFAIVVPQLRSHVFHLLIPTQVMLHDCQG